MRIEGTNFAATFSRSAGMLTSLVYAGREMLAPATNGLVGPILQVWRAPTDNDKGFGNWLARDWREAGLTNLVRRVDSFDVSQPKSNEVRVTVITTSTANPLNRAFIPSLNIDPFDCRIHLRTGLLPSLVPLRFRTPIGRE